MAKNLFIAYDLIAPGQNYDTVQAQIKQLGDPQKLQYSLYYLHTHLSRAEVYKRVNAVMDQNDSLVVIEALGVTLSHPQQVVNALNAVWNLQSA